MPAPVLSVTKDERVGIGATQPASKLHVNGSVTIADQSEIFFQDRGRIHSYDDHHALVFDRHNDRLELHEWGDIHLFTGGSLAGPPTEKVTIRRNGSVQIAGVGQATPIHTQLQVGRLGTQGFDADSGYPGWDGGIHTWDVYAEGSVGVGRNGSLDSWMNSSGFHSSGGKHFVIEHPLDPRRSLVHASLEGPELAIFYRGEATLEGGHATVELPPYFEAIARPEARTVTLTAKSVAGEKVSALAASAVEHGSFTVFAIGGENPAQPFFWEVTAVRADLAALEVEPVREVVAGTTTGGGE